MTTPESLNPFTIPLKGVSLIEASAGTGKTYSITSLYLRMLLECGLPVDRLLVVTFTKAATEELRERIRGRIKSALAFLENPGAAGEDALFEWLEQRGDRDEAIRALKIALASMDGAAVYTIHGFCQRVLTDNAFDTGMAFELDFIEDEALLRDQAVEDFWRRWFGGSRLSPAIAERLLDFVADPAALLDRIRKRLSGEVKLLPPSRNADDVVDEIESSLAALTTAHDRLKALWPEARNEVEDFLYNNTGKNKNSYNPTAIDKAWSAVEELCTREAPMLSP
ncbi:MAG TPA: exodeoxyribonuclease V subunit beta, partial [Gammaproteobacteria bacterium]|nr:exodeoxyribonuclease V subunit beta [Gammaproteobacteria bacterium]